MLEKMVIQYYRLQSMTIDRLSAIETIAPLALRLYLAPVFWFAAINKWDPFDATSSLDSIIEWFGNSDWGLGLPFPELMAYLAWGTEFLGAIFLVVGFATRWITIPLMVQMIVAMATVHWQNGWQAINDLKSPWADAQAGEALDRLSIAKDILHQYGNYDWLTEHGSLVSSNNGIEWAATYFIMLLALLFFGGGKYFSLDFYLDKFFRKKLPEA